jgi:hypothetical protein
MQIWRPCQSIYENILEIPNRLYPFVNEIDGRLVRGRQSYERALERAFENFGAGRFGYKLMLYREAFHLVGAILFLIVATFLSNRFLGGDLALYVLLCAAVLALTFQEFYLHPRRYGQHLNKSMVDWCAWVLPVLAYLFFFAAA